MDTKQQILTLTEQFYSENHKPKPFIVGQTPVPVSGKVFDQDDMKLLIESSLDFWLTTGRFNAQFEKELAAFIGTKHLLTTNSGSSSNLLAFAALTSPLLKDRAIQPGDEVISVAAGFPTTVNPILQYNCAPVFVDINPKTFNVDITKIEEAITNKTKAIMLAHTLGNPYEIDLIMNLADKYNLWVIEDCCDALGTTYNGQHVGTFGDIGTLSFYPAHHITTGEGGAVFTKNALLKKILLSIRDWGRDCWCEPGEDNTCQKRFDWTLGSLPEGYDHKYIYSHVGYNLKLTDMQAAVGVAQLKKLPEFIEKRKENFAYLKKELDGLRDFFDLPDPTPNSAPSWFGFPITITDSAPFTRRELMVALNKAKIGTRQLFGGNLIHHPYMSNQTYRISGNLVHTDRVMSHTFWIGTFPGLTIEMLDYIVTTLTTFCNTYNEVTV